MLRTCLRAAVGVVAMALWGLLLPVGSQAATKRTFSTPGYHWNGTLPKVAPTLPGKVIHLGDGIGPHVLVDAAGTGQIAYTSYPNVGPSTLHDCVLKRGQTACTANAGLLPPAQDPAGSLDSAGPVPLALGNQLLMLDYRYPDVWTLPDGTYGYPTFLYTSDDGGQTFTGPGIVGHTQPSGNAITYGGANPQIAWITDTETGGTFFQSTAAGAYGSERLNLGDQGPDEAYNGRLAVDPDGGRPVAEFSDLSDHIYVREWNGAGDIMQSANWSVAVINGQGYSRIVGGPAGVFLLYQKTYGGNLYLQRIVNGQPSGAAVAVTPNTDFWHANYAITEDASGGITVGWYVIGDTDQIVVRSTTDGGRTWSDPQVIARGITNPGEISLGAAQDGGGFAAFTTGDDSSPSHSEVDVAAFGTFSATGLPGLGNLTGTGAGGLGGDPLASESCTDVHFGDIDALAQAGCFLRDPTNPSSGAAITTGEIRLNGLQIIPDAGVKIVIDPRQHTINTTGQVSVVLRAPGIGDITLYHGELHLNLAGNLADAGQTLFAPLASAATSTLEGFPISGSIDIQIQHDSVVIPVSLKLPSYMGGVTASATLLANNATGLQVSSLHIGVDDLPLGALEIKNLSIDYTQSGNVWKGSAHINIPAGSPYFGIDASVEFDDGDFTMGSFEVDPGYPGIPIFEDAYLTGFGGSFDIHPTHKEFSGSIDIGAIPVDPPNYAIGVQGVVSIEFLSGGPVIVTISGSGQVHGEQVATAKATFQSNGFFEVAGDLDLDLDVVEIDANVDAFADLPAKAFSAQLNGTLQLVGEDIASASGIVSSKGAGACGSYFGVSAGFGYLWGGSPDVFFGSCDFSPYQVAPIDRAGQVAGHTQPEANVTVGHGTSVTNLEVHGTGGAPTVTLTDPQGHTITPVALSPSTAHDSSFQVADASHDVTYVTVVGPHTGGWKVGAAPGSVPIATVSAARGYPAPKVHVTVSGRGATRTLHYRVSGAPGLSVQFAERGKGSWALIGTAHGHRGALRFTPTPGAAGRRVISAIISNHGIPSRRETVGHYIAPAPPRPGPVHGLHVSRRGKAFRIGFGRASGAVHYTVHAVATDGHRYAWIVSGRAAHRRSVPALGYADTLTVTVAGVSSMNRTGPTARARATYASTVWQRAHRRPRHHRRRSGG